MNVQRNSSKPSAKGSADWFTGTVRLDSPFEATDPGSLSGAVVTFEPGARTNWHTHPLGQTLIVTAGQGWVQSDEHPRETVNPGDIIWFPPGEKHWHGATTTTAMTHIALQERLEGNAVTWLGPVSDEEYGR